MRLSRWDSVSGRKNDSLNIYYKTRDIRRVEGAFLISAALDTHLAIDAIYSSTFKIYQRY